jgi:hypothetical protein
MLSLPAILSLCQKRKGKKKKGQRLPVTKKPHRPRR